MRRLNNNSRGSDSRNEISGSRRKLALAVLLVLFIAVAYICLSDSGLAAGIRNDVLEKAGWQREGTEEGSRGGDASDARGAAGLPEANVSSADRLPQYNGTNYAEINGGVPDFPREVYERAGLVYENGKWKTSGTLQGVDSRRLIPYEEYGELDDLGRCTVCYGCLGEETMPADGEERGDISSIHPSGWAKAQGWERSHLIAWALGAENANSSNLITGTHYLNYDSMRPLEEEVEHYIWNTGGHVLYYSRPVFAGDELVARGVNMMAQSIEDGGDSISFNVYCFNVTPGADIDYMTGIVTTGEQAAQDARLYIINTRSRVFHYPSCDGVKQMSRHNRKEVTATRVELTSQGYTPCGSCEP